MGEKESEAASVPAILAECLLIRHLLSTEIWQASCSSSQTTLPSVDGASDSWRGRIQSNRWK